MKLRFPAHWATPTSNSDMNGTASSRLDHWTRPVCCAHSSEGSVHLVESLALKFGNRVVHPGAGAGGGNFVDAGVGAGVSAVGTVGAVGCHAGADVNVDGGATIGGAGADDHRDGSDDAGSEAAVDALDTVVGAGADAHRDVDGNGGAVADASPARRVATRFDVSMKGAILGPDKNTDIRSSLAIYRARVRARNVQAWRTALDLQKQRRRMHQPQSQQPVLNTDSTSKSMHPKFYYKCCQEIQYGTMEDICAHFVAIHGGVHQWVGHYVEAHVEEGLHFLSLRGLPDKPARPRRNKYSYQQP